MRISPSASSPIAPSTGSPPKTDAGPVQPIAVSNRAPHRSSSPLPTDKIAAQTVQRHTLNFACPTPGLSNESTQAFFALAAQGAPIAKKVPQVSAYHDYQLCDDYDWQRKSAEAVDPEVTQLLQAENAHFEKTMAPCRPLVDEIYAEMKGRILDHYKRLPVKNGDYMQWYEFVPGSEQERWMRKHIDTGKEQVLVDVAADAAGKQNYRMDDFMVSPDNEKIAVVFSEGGNEELVCVVRDIETQKELDRLHNVNRSGAVWTADSKAFFYSTRDEQLTGKKVMLHTLGESTETDKLIYEETQNKNCWVSLIESNDAKVVFISIGNFVDTELRLIRKDDPSSTPVLIHARKEGVLACADAAHGKVWMLTNENHGNFELFEMGLDAASTRRRRIAGSDERYITDVTAFDGFLRLEARDNGLDTLLLMDYETGEVRPIDVKEETKDEAYTVRFRNNPDFHTNVLRFEFSSMRTPTTTFEYDTRTGKTTTLMVEEVPSGHNPADYTTERLMLESRDGTLVPASLCYRNDFKKNGEGKMCVTAYGAYGSTTDPDFSAATLSLLDRGYAYMIVHARGGGELGEKWKKGGWRENRENTFNDVIDVVERVIERRYTKAGNIALIGGSAGGTMVGAVLNERPELWGAAVANMPLVDVLDTLLDGELRIVPPHWTLWGNPKANKRDFETIHAYCCYQQIREQDYPPVLVQAGMNDARTMYWGSLKWVSKLRDKKTNDNPLLLKTDLQTGHEGKAGRYERLQKLAESYAFLLTTNGNGKPCRPGTRVKNAPVTAIEHRAEMQ